VSDCQAQKTSPCAPLSGTAKVALLPTVKHSKHKLALCPTVKHRKPRHECCHLANSVSCHPRTTCYIAGCCHLANSMSCHPRPMCHVAGWMNSIRHIKNRFSTAIWALAISGFRIVSDTVVKCALTRRGRYVMFRITLLRTAGTMKKKSFKCPAKCIDVDYVIFSSACSWFHIRGAAVENAPSAIFIARQHTDARY